MLARRLSGFTNADPVIRTRALQKRFKATFFQLGIGIQQEDEFRPALNRQEIDTPSETIILNRPKDIRAKGKRLHFIGKQVRCSIGGRVIQKVGCYGNRHLAQACKKAAESIGDCREKRSTDQSRRSRLPSR